MILKLYGHLLLVYVDNNIHETFYSGCQERLHKKYCNGSIVVNRRFVGKNLFKKKEKL